jgi:hypothetical protein
MATLRWRVCYMMLRSVAPPAAADVARPARQAVASKQFRVLADGHDAALNDQRDALVGQSCSSRCSPAAHASEHGWALVG